MFRTVPLSIIRSFSTVHTAMVYVIQVCWQLVSRIRTELILHASCQKTCMTYTIAVCTMKNSWWWTEELSETCRVYSKNKFEKSVHLVGFITRIFWTLCRNNPFTWSSNFKTTVTVNQLNALISQIYFWIKTIYVSERTDLSFLRPDPARKLSANLFDINHCCVYSGKTPDDGQKNCPNM